MVLKIPPHASPPPVNSPQPTPLLIFASSPLCFSSLSLVSTACWTLLFLLAWSCSGTHSCCGFLKAIDKSCPQDDVLQPPSHPPALRFFLPPLSRCSLNLGRPVEMFHFGLNTHQHFQHFYQFWVSALTVANCRQKLLWQSWEGGLIYVYKHKYLEGSSIQSVVFFPLYFNK